MRRIIRIPRYRENTGKIIDVDLADRSFLVPNPHGISGLEHLPDDNAGDDPDEQRDPDQDAVESVKKMLKVKQNSTITKPSDEESKIVEVEEIDS